MNDDAVSGLMKDKFELGAEAGVAGGPVGRDASAGTDALMHAEILSYSRSRGLFVGVNLKGVVIKPEDDLNEAVTTKQRTRCLAMMRRPVLIQPCSQRRLASTPAPLTWTTQRRSSESHRCPAGAGAENFG
jgi:lipid-binding SYLF domain-containing protein